MMTDVVQVQAGITKTLLNQWQTKSSETFQVERQPVVLAEAEGCVVENEPSAPRPDVVRGTDDAELDAELPSRGKAQQLRQQWFSLTESSNVPRSKDATASVLAEVAAAADRPSVLENEPSERRPDVVSSADGGDEVIAMKKGYARNLAGFWSAPRGTDTADGPPRRPIELPRADVDDSAVKENEPQRLEGVVRADDMTEDELAIEKGRARTMASMWQNRQEEFRPRQPFKLDVEVKESNAGVYENAPTTLDDGVVRSTDQVDRYT